MITVKEALKISLSEELNEIEQKAYNIITNYIDNKIKDAFNGEFVEFQIEGSYMTKGCSFYIKDWISKPWRANIVVKKWKREYEMGGWKIEEKEYKDYRGITQTKYRLSIDPSYKRDEKLNKLLS